MLIQDISSATSAAGFASDSKPVAITASKQKGSLEPPQTAAKAAVEQQATQPTSAQLKSVVDSINQSMKQNNLNVEFSIDQDTKQSVIKVVESSTGQVIRQFPSEEILAVSRMIADAQRGALIKQQA